MPGHELLRGLDAEALREHGAERLDLHLAEAGERRDPSGADRRRPSRPSRRARPGRRSPRRRSRTDPAPGSPSRRGSGGSRASRGRPPRAAPDRSPRSSRASSVPSRCCSFSGPTNASRHGHLLVEREADQECERLACEQRVRLVVAGEVQTLGHGSILLRDRQSGSREDGDAAERSCRRTGDVVTVPAPVRCSAWIRSRRSAPGRGPGSSRHSQRRRLHRCAAGRRSRPAATC